MLDKLTVMMENVWMTEKIPAGWNDAIVMPVHKKGNRAYCTNYRAISLTEAPCKVMSRAMLNRLKIKRESTTRENQCGFRPGRGCRDAIFTVRQMQEKYRRYGKQLVLTTLDFKAAFPSVDRNALWKVMQIDGVPQKLINVFKAMYANPRSIVRVLGTDADDFACESGVLQGEISSPFLFNYVLDWVMRHAVDMHGEGLRIKEGDPNYKLTDIDFADDVVILTNSVDEAQIVVDRIAKYGNMVGLKLNAAKCELLVCFADNEKNKNNKNKNKNNNKKNEKSKKINNSTATMATLKIDGVEIKPTDSVRYLGSEISNDGRCEKDVSTRIARATAASISFGRLWSVKSSVKAKVALYKSCVRNVLLYGCESWALCKADLDKLQVFENDCLRRILRLRRADGMPIERLHKITRIGLDIATTVKKRRWLWLGHVIRKDERRLPRVAFMFDKQDGWRMRPGAPERCWESIVKSEAEDLLNCMSMTPKAWNEGWKQKMVAEVGGEGRGDRCRFRANVRDLLQRAGRPIRPVLSAIK